MPIQVNEIIIKAAVTEGAASAAGGAKTAGGGGDDKDALINACVEQVLEILRKEDKR